MIKKINNSTGLRVSKAAGRVPSAKINIADDYNELINAAFQPLIDYKKNNIPNVSRGTMKARQ